MALMAAYMVLVQVHRSAGAVLANELGDSHALPPTEIAGIVGALFLASALAQLPTGLAFDRFGPRRTLAASGVIALLGVAVFALAEGGAALAAGRFLIGLGHGGVIAGIYLLAIAWVAPDRVATAIATVVAVAGGLGAILATTPLVFALRELGHQATFLGAAVLTGILTLALALRVRDAPPGRRVATRPESLGESLQGLWQVARDRRLWPLYAMATCFTAPFMTIGGLWAGPYLRDVHGLDKAETSLVLMAMMVVFHLGTLAYGPLDRLLNTRKWVVFGGAACLAASSATLALVTRPGLAFAVVMLCAVALFAPFYSVLAAHCRGFVSVERAGRAIACVNLAGLLTVFAAQTATGWLVERAAVAGAGAGDGYRQAFGAVSVLLAAALALYARADDSPPR